MVLITTPNNENLDNETVYCPCCENSFHRWQHVRSWSSDSLSLYLIKHGFKVILTKEIDFALNKDLGVLRYYIKTAINKFYRKKLPNLIIIAQKQ